MIFEKLYIIGFTIVTGFYLHVMLFYFLISFLVVQIFDIPVDLFLPFLNVQYIFESSETETEIQQAELNMETCTRKVTMSTPKECHICYDQLIEGVRLFCPCKKVYHSSCLQRWLEINRSCPICRKVVE